MKPVQEAQPNHQLKQQRLLRNWTQAQVAEKINTTSLTVSRWERGLLIPSLYFRHKLCELFEQSPALLGFLSETEAEPDMKNKNGEKPAVPPRPFAPDQTQEHLPETEGIVENYPFCGRGSELNTLARWIVHERARLITLLGMGGIGKTTLARHCTNLVASSFSCVVWYSLYNAPSFQELVQQCVAAIESQLSLEPTTSEEPTLARLITLLYQQRCLLILDNLDTILASGSAQSTYQDGYEAYQKLLEQVCAQAHQSCILLTSREKPADLAFFESQYPQVRSLSLSGLNLHDSQHLLKATGIVGDHTAWAAFVRLYAGNPLALKIVTETICEVFNSDLAFFLREGTMIFDGIQLLLDQHFTRLSPIEQALLYWLAIEREPISLDVFSANFKQQLPRRLLIENIQSLRRRALIEQHQTTFGLQPVVLEYITERLIEHIAQEIITARPLLLLAYPLLKSPGKEYIHNSQVQLILRPLLNKLLSRFQSKKRLEEQFEQLLNTLRTLPLEEQGYAAGTIVNLLILLNGHLRDKDFSYLTIWQADLRKAEAQHTDLTASDLNDSLFMETFGEIASVTLSRDGQYLAAGSFTGQISLWHMASGTLLHTISAHNRTVWTLAFSADSGILVSGGYDATVKVWELPGGRCLHMFQEHTRWVKSIAFHPDGTMLATCSDDGSIKLWELNTGCCLKTLHGQGGPIWSVAFGPDGSLVSGNNVGEITWWDYHSGKHLRIVSAHNRSAAISLAFRPEGGILASAGGDGTITIWTAKSGAPLTTLHAHNDRIRSIAFSPDNLLVSGGHDGIIKIWRIDEAERKGYCLTPLPNPGNRVWSLAFNQDGILACGSPNRVTLWKLGRIGEEQQCLRVMQGYSRLISTLSFSPDGTIVASGDNIGTITIWDRDSGQHLMKLPGHQHQGRVHAVAFHPHQPLLVSGSDDKKVRIWNLQSGQCVKILQEHTGDIWSLAFCHDGMTFASGSADSTIKIWQTSSGACLHTLRGHTGWPWPLAFHPTDKLLASGSTTGEIKLWDLNSGQCLQTWQASSHAISALSFDLSGGTLVSSSSEGHIQHWMVSNGRMLKTQHGRSYTSWLNSASFSQDSTFLAISNDDYTIQIYDVNNGTSLQTTSKHSGAIWSVAFHPDAHIVASGSDDGNIMLWDTQTGAHLTTLSSERPYEELKINAVTGITEAQKVSLRVFGASDFSA